MLVELAMLTFAVTSTGAPASPASSPVYPERPSATQPLTLGDHAANRSSLWLAKSSGSGSRGTRSSKGSSNRGAGGYQQSGEGGYRQTGQGGYQGSGQGRKDMNITPPNSPGGVRTTPPSTPPWSPQWSPPGS